MAEKAPDAKAPEAAKPVDEKPDNTKPLGKPGIKDVKVYGTNKIPVETEFERAPNYALKDGQTKLAKNLRLLRYLEKTQRIPKNDKKMWLSDILHEIVNKNCRDDPSIMLRSQCPRFGEYLRDLALQLFKTKKLNIDNNEIELLGGIKLGSSGTPSSTPESKSDSPEAEAEAPETPDSEPSDSEPSEPAYGNIQITIKIPMDAFKKRVPEDVNDLHAVANDLQRIFQRLNDLYDLAGYDQPTRTLLKMQLELKHTLRQRIAELTAM
jgi:hypothetical protein